MTSLSDNPEEMTAFPAGETGKSVMASGARAELGRVIAGVDTRETSNG